MEKPWGREYVVHTESYTVKRLTMFKGFMCSVQYHPKKDETAIAFSGNINVVFLKNEVKNLPAAEVTMQVLEKYISARNVLKPGETIVIPPGVVHYMHAAGEECVYFEASTPDTETVRVFDPNAHLRKGEDVAR